MRSRHPLAGLPSWIQLGNRIAELSPASRPPPTSCGVTCRGSTAGTAGKAGAPALISVPRAGSCASPPRSRLQPHQRGPFTEARLLAVACGATAEPVERRVRGWRRVDRKAAPAGEDGAQMCLARRGLSLRVDQVGMVVPQERLLPEVGAVVLRALEQVPAAAAGTRARGGIGRP